MTRKDIINILNSRSLSPLKKLGQNFLWNTNITSAIAESLNLDKNDNVIEIGPGLGALTDELIKKESNLTCVEIDKGLFAYLNDKYSESDVKIIHSDFLKYNSDLKFNKAVSNLPYYCASEILFKLIDDHHPEIITVMLQKEMAERISADPGDEQYGALTASLSLNYKSENVINVSPDNFYPEPEVKSSVLKLRHNGKCYNSEERIMFRTVVKSAFWGRRKRIIKSLSDSPHMNISKNVLAEVLEMSKIDADKRAEEISPEEFMIISKSIIGNYPNEI